MCTIYSHIVFALEYFPQQKFSLLSKNNEILKELFEFVTISKFKKRIVFVKTIWENRVFRIVDIQG